MESGVNLSGSLSWGRKQTLQPLVSSTHSIHTGVRTVGHTSKGPGGDWAVKAGQGPACHTDHLCVSGTSSRDHPEGHSLVLQSCFLLPSGPSFCSPTGAGVRAALIQKEHPSPERSLSTSHSNQETRRLQLGENPSLSLAGATPFSLQPC